MIASRFRPHPFLLLALLAAAPVSAQEVVQALPGTTDADALAADMRRVASNPRDVDALLDAARLSLRLGDGRAAAALLQRAENVDPRDPRVKAGQGSVLVQSERPGQALRYFANAEAQGLDSAGFAADRGLAYDLTGQQERAQRDYARALRVAPNDDETIRRYALSLGISGQRQRALALLDPLVRRSDRAAWRTQAFVLAMTGDTAGAQRIAATMMPGGASGLSAFFERLPTLPATDRAFAVHFGQVRPTPERLADARLAPPVAPLPREPVVLARAELPVPDRRARRERGRTGTSVAAASAAVLAAAPARREAVPQLTAPARALAPSTFPPTPVQLPGRPAQAPAVSAPRAPVVLATSGQGALDPSRRPPAATSAPSVAATASAPVANALSAVQATATMPSGPVQRAAATPTPAPVQPAAATPTSGPVQAAVTTPPAAVQLAGATPTLAQPGPASPAPRAPVELATAAPSSNGSAPFGSPAINAAMEPVQVVAVPASDPVAATAAPPTQPVRPGVARGSEDTILARIIAGLSIPGAELGVEEPARATPPAAVAVSAPLVTPGLAQAPVQAIAQADKASLEKLAATRAAADKRAAERKAAADKKALADKKAAAEKKALADKAAAEKKIERTNPERIWVQVAGGASERDLPKAYAAVKARAPAVFGSRGGYTTPLRATNRVLTGPFKTDAEARAFVNDLSRAGVSAFTFTSDAGQPVKKLGATGKGDDEPDADDDKPTVARGKRRR